MAGPGSVKGTEKTPASPSTAEGQPARTGVGTGCTEMHEDPFPTQLIARMKARADALRKVCGSGKNGENVSGWVSSRGAERYFVDNASGQLCATGTYQVRCEPEPPVSPSPLPQDKPPKAERATTAALQGADMSATERELGDVAREAQRDMADIKRAGTSIADITERAEKAFAEADK